MVPKSWTVLISDFGNSANFGDNVLSKQEPDKYDKVRSKIEKTINPYIKVKIPMPDGVDKDAFLNLECDKDFIECLKTQAKVWLRKL